MESTITKQYKRSEWPGCDVYLLQRLFPGSNGWSARTHLYVYMSQDDGSTYRAVQVKTEDEAASVADAFYKHLDDHACAMCGGCTCGNDKCEFGTQCSHPRA